MYSIGEGGVWRVSKSTRKKINFKIKPKKQVRINIFPKRFLHPLQTRGIAANKQLYQEIEPQCANFLT